MTVTTRQYAHLADHSYGRDERGNEVDLKSLVDKETEIGGIFYKVLAYSDRPSGYQGAVYQRVDTGEIIVAHRGTEFDRQKLKDLGQTDLGMAITGTNRQAEDAIALTREALQLAERSRNSGQPVPSITVTGHSLGGTLAQVSGHYFGLKGETFNAYGAGGLKVRNPDTGEYYRLPKGGNDFVNHVMAGDLVSAAAPQYGQVRVYASQREIDILQRYGYENNRNPLDLRHTVAAAVDNMRKGSHSMHNFTSWDGDYRPDQPIQEQAGAQALAQQYAPMISKFRNDVQMHRMIYTQEPARELFNNAPTLPAGSPARQLQEKHLKEQMEQDPEYQRLRDSLKNQTPGSFFQSLPGLSSEAPAGKEKSPLDTYLDNAIASFERGDMKEFSRLTAEFGNREPGRQLMAQAEQSLEQDRQRQQQQEIEQQQAQQIRGPVMRMG